MKNIEDYRFVFVGGLHRSGTTPLCRLLGTSNDISVFSNTGAIEDEGLYLQEAYPVGVDDGIGTMALGPDAHWTELSPYVGPAKERLFSDWSRYWDLDKHVLAEKTPANLIRSRMLNAVFPNACFIFMMRHPVAAIMASVKWHTRDSLEAMMQNWIKAHEYMLEDAQYINSCVLKYEEFTVNPSAYTNDLRRTIGINTDFDFSAIMPGLNEKYYRHWRDGRYRLWSKYPLINRIKTAHNKMLIRGIEARYEKLINKFGYSFSETY